MSASTGAPADEKIEATAGLAFSWTDVAFDVPAPYATEPELMRHLGFRLPVPGYELSQETFRIWAPEPSTNRAWGLLVWISPGDDPHIPPKWENEMVHRDLLLVTPRNAGNSRHAIQRCQLALDAVCNMARRYRLDRDRIYIGGFSGGGRIASIMGVAYADVFTGTIAVCGVDFYADVRSSEGDMFPATYRPDPGVLRLAKQRGRFVLVTGERDANRENTKWTAADGFMRHSFKAVSYLEVPGMGHALPPAAVFGQALVLLSKRDPVERESSKTDPKRQ